MSIGELRPSISILFNKEIYTILECEHAKLGRGSAFCRVRLKNIKTSQVLDFTVRDSDKIEEAFIERRRLQYLYHEDNIYHFIDLETYNDLVLDSSNIEDKIIWLKDNLELTGLFYNNELINLELPKSMSLKVIETDPGFKGDTVKTGTKPAKLETGITIAVPLFINVGDTIKVDTDKKEYTGRI
ncbi:MAG: elongation factor P [Candidatus Omnitrophica bacterium 4484_171]|nr:MAG: elongation factor P [Candidatus Omnitrophica bacterium 4484_171]